MKKLKITGIVILAIFLIFSIVCISWYTYVKMSAPKRVVSTTFEIGLQTTTDGNTRYFMEVNSYDNCYEVKFNYMLDENREHFFSQGLQYYSESGNVVFKSDYENVVTSHYVNFWDWTFEEWDHRRIYTTSNNVSRRNYMSSNDYEDCLDSTNPIDNETRFKITLDKNGETLVYLMEFKGNILRSENEKYKNWRSMYTRYTDVYDVYDVERLVGLVYEGIQPLSYGTSHSCLFEFGDLFNYYEPVEGQVGVWDQVEERDTNLIYEDIKSYYSIKVTKHKGNIEKASQSLFNCVNGNASFNIGNTDSEDYFYGKTEINVDNEIGSSELSYVKITDSHVALKLSDDFNSAYKEYHEKIELVVLVNLDLIKADGYEFMGFALDSGLSDYSIKNCQTVETINGQLVYSEVAYG